MKKVVVITGGSEGLGYAVAKRLKKDNRIFIISHDLEKLTKASKELDCEYYCCDVTNYQEVEDTIESILDEVGQIDVLINNAGVWLAGDLTDTGYDRISHCIDVNTKGPIYMMKATLPSYT